ncbi:MAG: hypothetical protein AAF658_19555, partial [Myxococcota bacterium]
MRKMKIVSSLILLFASGCTLGLAELTDEIFLSCESDSDCPEGLACSTTASVCVNPLVRLTPQASLARNAANTPLDQVPLQLQISDPNPDDQLNVQLQYEIDNVTGFATLDSTEFTAENQTVELSWNALVDAADAEATTGALTKYVANLDGSDTPAAPADASARPFRLRRTLVTLRAIVTD